MREHVRLIRELVGHKVFVWALAGYFACEVFCAVHALVCLAEDDFCADGVENLSALQSHVLRHNQKEVVAFYAAD